MDDTNNPPKGGTGETASEEALDALAEFFPDDPETDNEGDDEADNAEETKAEDADESDNSDEDDADDADEDSEDPDDDDDDDKDRDEPYDRGRFAAHNARVKLDDGSTVTVKELVEGSLRQGDYTRKTQEVSELRKTLESGEQRVSQLQQQLDEQLEKVSWWLEQTRPQMPEGEASEDPAVFMEYQQQRARWDQAQEYWSREFSQRQQQITSQQKQQFHDYAAKEREALERAVPALRDPSKRDAFTREAVRVAAEFGISEEELRSVVDHRQLLILKDAMELRRLKARAPKVRKDLEGKPRMLKGRKRSTPRQADERARRERTERLRKDGSLDAGAAAIADLI